MFTLVIPGVLIPGHLSNRHNGHGAKCHGAKRLNDRLTTSMDPRELFLATISIWKMSAIICY